jgi:hypothetical protein
MRCVVFRFGTLLAKVDARDSDARRTNGSRKIYLARLSIPVTMLSS